MHIQRLVQVEKTNHINIYGDSMNPTFKAGDKVAVQQIFNFDALQWGEAHLIITNSEANNMRTVKNVHYYEGDDTKIILRSCNPDYFGDTVIPKSSILSMHIIKASLRILNY